MGVHSGHDDAHPLPHPALATLLNRRLAGVDDALFIFCPFLFCSAVLCRALLCLPPTLMRINAPGRSSFSHIPELLGILNFSLVTSSSTHEAVLRLSKGRFMAPRAKVCTSSYLVQPFSLLLRLPLTVYRLLLTSGRADASACISAMQ